MDTIPVEMGYAKRGWFRLQIPALLPKKESGSPIYIQQYLYPALRRYFAGKPPALYQNCVLAYRHVYCRERPERAYRDHDNIEVNMVTDIITLYLLPDDAPRRCAHYYCSAAGEVDCTEAYVAVSYTHLTGTIVVKETKTIEGYTIDPASQSQTVVVNPEDTQTLTFYNQPIGGCLLYTSRCV